MEINPQNYEELIAEIGQKFKDVNTELTACKLSLSALKSKCSDLEQRLEAATRRSATHKKYNMPLEGFAGRFDEAATDWDLLQWFQALSASRPVN